MQNYSKEYQDIFVSTLIPKPGFFLDIGMGDPINGNNSYYLELNGWSGFMFDQTPKDVEQANSIRRNTAFVCDATTFNWRQFLRSHNCPYVIDYISLDVDAANIDVIQHFPFDEFEFKIMTFEHDRYNSNDVRKLSAKRALWDHYQYATILDNAIVPGTNLEWEDWWINRKYFDTNQISSMIRCSMDTKSYLNIN